ncbi:unnamed protein product [Gongylonema pulchrum]|uniref:PHB domain-containing protein n=1 Tax=Gongylonema pulchrum TaxID=637853 RepID=A0A183E0R4_9BILA|nr:unnamed protein product [Gongylonema pulchrum]
MISLGSLGAELFFLASNPVVLPNPKDVALTGSDVVRANKYMLGLSTRAPAKWTSDDGDLLDGGFFNRPRALAIVTVSDGMALKNLSESRYVLSKGGMGFDHGELIDSKLFGEEQEWVLMNKAGLIGSRIADDAQNVLKKTEVKTKLEPLRKEIDNLYKIAQSVKKSEVIRSARTPTIFIINVQGLENAQQQQHLSVDQYAQALSELEKAISYLTSALQTAYGDRVIVELITESHSESKTRQKRQVTMPKIACKITS